MSKFHALNEPFVGRTAALAIVIVWAAAATAQTQSDSNAANPPAGRIDFSRINLPPATVELDLTQGMVNDLFGIGDAAAAGVAESLLKAADANRGAEGTRLAAQKLAAAREILQLTRQVVREVRVRVYDNRPNEPEVPFDKLMAQFEDQLRTANWETVARIRQGRQNARVALLREEGAVRGAFLILTEGSDVVVANIVADISPDNVKKLTAAASAIGLEAGLMDVLETEMRQLRQRQKTRAVSVEPKDLPTPTPPPAPAPAQK
jgi:hypothetical protein